MNQQSNKKLADAFLEKLSSAFGEEHFAKTPLDSVSESGTHPQNAGKNRETVFVSTPRQKKDDISPEERQFLDLISQGLTVGDACLRAGLSRASVYRRRHAEYKFEKLWDEALDIAGDRLEEEADRRGVSGWEETVYHKGSAVGVRKRYSDRMLMFRLRALKPRRYSSVRG